MNNNQFSRIKYLNAKTLFIAWCFLLLIPIIAINSALNSFINFKYNKSKVEIKSKISLEAEKFKKDMIPTEYVSSTLNAFDTNYGFKNFGNHIPKLERYENLSAKKLLKEIELKTKLKVACVIYYGPDTDHISFSQGETLRNAKLRKPPNILLKRLFGFLNKQISRTPIKYYKTFRKLQTYFSSISPIKASNDMKFFIKTIFGNISEVEMHDKKVIQTISSKLGNTGKTFLYYSEASYTKEGKRSNLGGYIAVIKLSTISSKAIIKYATNNIFYKNLQRQCITSKIQLSIPEDFRPLDIYKFKETHNGLSLDTTVPQSFLILLAQHGEFRVKHLKYLSKHYPLLRVTANNTTLKPYINEYMKSIRTVFIIILLAGAILCLHLALFGTIFHISINIKFIISIMVALLLPISMLAFASKTHQSFSNSVTKASLKNYLTNRLLEFRKQFGVFISKYEIKNLRLSQLPHKKVSPDYLRKWIIKSDAEKIYYFQPNKPTQIINNPPNLRTKLSILDQSTVIFGETALETIINIQIDRKQAKSFANVIRNNGSAPSIAIPINHLGKLISTNKNAPDSKFSFIIINDKKRTPTALIIIRYSTQFLVSKFFSQPNMSNKLNEIWRNYKIDFNFSIKDKETELFIHGIKKLSQEDKLQIELAKYLRKPIFQESENTIEYYEPVETLNYIGIAKATNIKNNSYRVARIKMFGILIYFITLLAFIFLLGKLLYINPINQISNQLLQISNGNLKHRCNIITGDEFEQLAQSFNQMTKGIAEKEEIEKFVSKAVLNNMNTMGDSDLKPGGDLIEASILFCEINDFTEFSSNHTANETIELLNLFVSITSHVCNKFDGIIDKIIDGSILIIFNKRNHPENACKTASRMLLELKDKTNGKFSCHSGISTGKLIFGKIGSRTGKLDFTVIGDTVNMAARLKSMHKIAKASRILISNATNTVLPDYIESIELGEIAIKGKKKKQQVFELLDLS